MHILEIETLVNSLHQINIAFSDKLDRDEDYQVVKKLPNRENATTPHDIICGANLRAKINMKYGGQAITDAKTKLDDALVQFQDALSLVQNSAIESNAESACRTVTMDVNLSNGKSICLEAAENAVALAKKYSGSSRKAEKATVTTTTRPDAEIQLMEIPTTDLWVPCTPKAFPEKIIGNSNPVTRRHHNINEIPCYQISSNSFSLGGAITVAIITLVSAACVGIANTEPAFAAMFIH